MVRVLKLKIFMTVFSHLREEISIPNQELKCKNTHFYLLCIATGIIAKGYKILSVENKVYQRKLIQISVNPALFLSAWIH